MFPMAYQVAGMFTGNDYLALANGVRISPEEVVDYIEQTLETLYTAGARRCVH